MLAMLIDYSVQYFISLCVRGSFFCSFLSVLFFFLDSGGLCCFALVLITCQQKQLGLPDNLDLSSKDRCLPIGECAVPFNEAQPCKCPYNFKGIHCEQCAAGYGHFILGTTGQKKKKQKKNWLWRCILYVYRGPVQLQGHYLRAMRGRVCPRIL